MKLNRFAICAGLLWLLATGISSQAGGMVEQWGVFQIILPGPTNGNPFVDVTLSARFTQGDV